MEEIDGEDPVRKAFSKMSIQLYNYGEGWVLGRCFYLISSLSLFLSLSLSLHPSLSLSQLIGRKQKSEQKKKSRIWVLIA